MNETPQHYTQRILGYVQGPQSLVASSKGRWHWRSHGQIHVGNPGGDGIPCREGGLHRIAHRLGPWRFARFRFGGFPGDDCRNFSGRGGTRNVFSQAG